jgi:hypothetical protein
MAAWGVAGGLLLVPLVAMRFTDEVAWDVADFVFAGVLIGGVGLGYELAVRTSRDRAYRAGAAVALGAGLMLVWINAAVGIIGSEDDKANLMYAGVLAVAVTGAVVARFRPAGMARALVATAIAQGLVAAVALAFGMASPVAGPGEILALTGSFAALWLLSAMLFRRAAQGRRDDG